LIQQIEVTSKIGGFIVKAATAVGALLLLIYCSRIGFYPSGVTLGDALLFVFFSLGFCFAYGTVFYMLFCLGCLLTPFFRWAQRLMTFLNVARLSKKTVHSWQRVGHLTWDDLYVVFPGIVMLIIVLIVGSEKWEMALGLASSAVAVFLWWTFVLKNPQIMDEPKIKLTIDSSLPDAEANSLSGYKRSVAWIIFLFIPIVVFNGMLGLALDAAAKLIGVRAEHVSVQIPKERVRLVQNLFQDLPAATNRFEVLTDANGAVLKGVDILFQGIGTRTLISIRLPKEEIRLPLPSREVVVISTTPNPALQRTPPRVHP